MNPFGTSGWMQEKSLDKRTKQKEEVDISVLQETQECTGQTMPLIKFSVLVQRDRFVGQLGEILRNWLTYEEPFFSFIR